MQKLSHEMIGLDASFVASLDKGENYKGFKLFYWFCFFDTLEYFRIFFFFFLVFLCLYDSFFLVTSDQASLKAEHQAIFNAANEAIVKEKNKKRGRNKISAKLKRKQKNVVDAQTIKLKEKLQKEREDRESKKEGAAPRKTLAQEYGVLARFVKKT